MFKLLSRAYADVHPMMMDRSENRCGGNFLKRGSIINGADWYSFTGGATSAGRGWGGSRGVQRLDGAGLGRVGVWRLGGVGAGPNSKVCCWDPVGDPGKQGGASPDGEEAGLSFGFCLDEKLLCDCCGGPRPAASVVYFMNTYI